MYSFGEKELSNHYINRIETIKTNLLLEYEKNLNGLIDKIIDLHAESTIIEEKKLNKDNDLSEENLAYKCQLIKNLKNKEFESFKKDIDIIVFPCCLDILKLEIIKTFNGHIFNFLQPKIEELMAGVQKVRRKNI